MPNNDTGRDSVTMETGVSQLKLTPEAIAALRQVRDFVITMRGRASESVADFDGALDFLFGERGREMFSGGDDDGEAERRIKEMMSDGGMQEMQPQTIGLSLEARRLGRYHENQQRARERALDEEADAIVDGIFHC